jgi:hypothetical protein
MQLNASAKRAGLALFLFFLVKGLAWLVVLGAGTLGISAI